MNERNEFLMMRRIEALEKYLKDAKDAEKIEKGCAPVLFGLSALVLSCSIAVYLYFSAITGSMEKQVQTLKQLTEQIQSIEKSLAHLRSRNNG
jgi:hypothetical protein